MISREGTRTACRARLGLWGKTEGVTRRAANDNAAPDCPIRFQGQWFDEESGLHYNRFRYYDPEAGQYLSPDPIGLAGGYQAARVCGRPERLGRSARAEHMQWHVSSSGQAEASDTAA